MDQPLRKPLRVVLVRLKFFAMICCLSIKPLAVNAVYYMKLDFFEDYLTIYYLHTENQRLVHLKMMVYLQPMEGSFYIWTYIYIHITLGWVNPLNSHPLSLLANWNLLDFLVHPPIFRWTIQSCQTLTILDLGYKITYSPCGTHLQNVNWLN